jgi:hypothetical protein
MSWKKFKKSINLQRKGKIFNQTSYYFGSTGNLTKSTNSDILLLGYDEKLSIFNNVGKLVSQFPFSSEISSLFLKDIYDTGENVFVSFSYSGEIRVFSKEGSKIWKTKLPAGITTGQVGNLDYDPGLEIIIVLEDHRIFVLDNQGQIIAKYQHSTRINFVDIALINSSQKKVVVFVDDKDTIHVLDIEKTVTPLPIKISPIIGFAIANVYDTTLIAIADDQNSIQLLDKKGNVFETYRCKAPIQYITAGPLFLPNCDAIVAILENNYVEIIEIEVKNPEDYIKHENKSSIPTTPLQSKKITPVSAQLEFNPDLYHSFPSQTSSTNTNASDLAVKKQVLRTDLSGTTDLRCPECGDYLPKSIVQKVRSGKDAYCEECGRELKRSDF